MAIKDIIPWFSEKPSIESNNSLLALQNEFNNLFDNFWRDRNFSSEIFEKELTKFQPNINIAENDNNYVVSAELPGMDEKNIELELKGNTLILKGEKKEEYEEKKKGNVYSERRYGSFFRQIPLPDEVEIEKVEAKFKNGVLNIELPKTEKAKTSHKQIEIKAE